MHGFSRKIIQERRKALEEMKVEGHTYQVLPTPSSLPPLCLLSTGLSFPSSSQKRGEDVMKGSKRKYLDFIDILLEARVST